MQGVKPPKMWYKQEIQKAVFKERRGRFLHKSFLSEIETDGPVNP